MSHKNNFRSGDGYSGGGGNYLDTGTVTGKTKRPAADNLSEVTNLAKALDISNEEARKVLQTEVKSESIQKTATIDDLINKIQFYDNQNKELEV